MKKGLRRGGGARHAGAVWVADIGVPREAYELLGITVPEWLFGKASTVKL